MADEVMTTSSSGGKKGTKPQRYDLLSREFMDAVSEVLAYGAAKYSTNGETGNHNWRKGYEWSKSYAALMRHMTAFWDGETYDEESGLAHLAHAGCHISFMLTWLAEQGEGGQFDDRYRPERPDPSMVLCAGCHLNASAPAGECPTGWRVTADAILCPECAWLS